MNIVKTMVALVLLGVTSIALAMPINAPVPDGRYIADWNGTGLDVAWAAPCSIFTPSCGVIDLSFQSGLGWRLADAAEVALLDANLQALDFVFSGAVGGSGGRGVFACASPYFSTGHTHCDWSNGNADLWDFGDGSAGAGHWEAIVVRGESGGPSPVPAPATLALLGLGLAGLGWSRRKKS